MNASDRKRSCLDDLEALLAGDQATTLDEAFAECVGRAVRVAAGDDEDDASSLLCARAEGLLARAASRAGSLAPSMLDAHPTSPLTAWLTQPRGPFAAAVEEADRLGARAAGLRAVAFESEAQKRAQARADGTASAIASAARSQSAAMFEAGLEAEVRIANGGVVPDDDTPLLALSSIVAHRLAAALRGELLEDAAPLRRCVIDPELARSLGTALAQAFARPFALDVALDALVLVPRAAVPELTLHSASASSSDEPIEVLPGVRVQPRGDELEVTWEGDASPVLLPIVGGVVGEPCASRSGYDEAHLLFLLSASEDIEGHALVVGGHAAFFRAVGR